MCRQTPRGGLQQRNAFAQKLTNEVYELLPPPHYQKSHLWAIPPHANVTLEHRKNVNGRDELWVAEIADQA